LNAWVAKLLGDPAKARCIIERLEPGTGSVLESKEIRLHQLGLAPLDFIYAVEGGQDGQRAEIEQRILYTLMRRPDGFSPGSLLRIHPARKPEWKIDDLSYGEFGELLRTVRKLFTSVRGIDADDLNPPERGENFTVDVLELEKRAAGAERSLGRSLEDFQGQLAQPDTADLEALRELIIQSAAFGIPGAVPLSPAGDSAVDRQTLLTQADSIRKELAQRAAQLAGLAAGFDAGTARAEEKRDHALARLHFVFGKPFVSSSGNPSSYCPVFPPQTPQSWRMRWPTA